MPRHTPAIRSFNGGEASALMEGRADLAWYPSSLRSALNCILTPQGPLIGRSGTQFVTTARTDVSASTIIPFIFTNDQSQIIEINDDRIRFIDESGLQVYAGVDAELISTPGDPMEITAVGLNSAVGDQVVLSGYDPDYNLNGVTANIVAKSTDDYTLDITFPPKAAADGTVQKVYDVVHTYTEEQRERMTPIQDKDTVYMPVAETRPRKLTRFSDYDWRLVDFTTLDGPYLGINDTTTTLTPAASGNAIPTMTTNTAPSGTASGSSARGSVAAGGSFLGRTVPLALAATDYFNAFDTDADETTWTYWASSTAQQAWLAYEFPAPVTVDGYAIHLAMDNQDTSYNARDYAPRSWTFQGYTGSVWVTLDKQTNYALWDDLKSVFFPIKAPGAYAKYRIVVKETLREGPLEVRIGRLVMRSTDSGSTTLTASSTAGINGDVGFLETDIGRLVRLEGDDGYWRPYVITARSSATVVSVTLLGEPLRTAVGTTRWRLGLWSDTTGWPSCGHISNDRLYLGGPDNAVAGSVVGAYSNFAQTEPDGTVLDDNAIVRFVQSKRSGTVQWITSDDKGLLIGTTEGEYTVEKPSNLANYTPSAFDIREATRRGSAAIEPLRVDNKTLYVQRNKRTLREFTYTYEAEGFKSSNLSKWASHLGLQRFTEMDYAAEPHSIGWIRRADGSVVGVTYLPEEDVLGWHRHDFAGAVVESLAVIPQEDQQQDMLWLQTKRIINGHERRYIEYMKRPWDFGDTLDQAHFVDCALRYEGEPTLTVYGLQHLEQQFVFGLADGKPIPTKQVIGGAVTLDSEASNIVLGLGFDSIAEVARIEGGTYEGTSMGKKTRVQAVSIAVWDTAYGEIGKYDENEGEFQYQPLEFRERADQIAPVRLHTEIVGPVTMEPGWDTNPSVAVRRPKEQPLPFNMLALLPRMQITDEA